MTKVTLALLMMIKIVAIMSPIVQFIKTAQSDLSVLLAILIAFKLLPETRLQWFVMGRIYYIFFRSSSLVLAVLVLIMYFRRLSSMNVLVLVLRMPLTMQGLAKAVIGSSRPRGLAVWIFLSMFILFIFNTLTLDRSTLPSRALESRVMRGAAIV